MHQELVNFVCRTQHGAEMCRKLQQSRHYQVLASGCNAKTGEFVVVCADKTYYLDKLNTEQQVLLSKKAQKKLSSLCDLQPNTPLSSTYNSGTLYS